MNKFKKNNEIDFDLIKKYHKKYGNKKICQFELDINKFEEIYNCKDIEKIALFSKCFISNNKNKKVYVLSWFFAIFLRIIFPIFFSGLSYIFLFLLGKYTNLDNNYIIFFYLIYNVFVISTWISFNKWRIYTKEEMINNPLKYWKNFFANSWIDKSTANICFWKTLFYFIKNEEFFNLCKNNMNDAEYKDFFSSVLKNIFDQIDFFYLSDFKEVTIEKIDSNQLLDDKKISKKCKKNYFKKTEIFKKENLKRKNIMFFVCFVSFFTWIKYLFGYFFISVFLSLFAGLIYFYV